MRFANHLKLAFSIIVLISLHACSSVPYTHDAAAGAGKETGKEVKAKVIKPLPPEAEKLFMQALQEAKNGNDEKAIPLLKQLTEKYPDLSGAYTNLGLIYLRSQKNGEARKAFEKAIQIKPDNAVAHTHLGIIFRQEGKFRNAEQNYINALAANKQYALAHLNIGILYDIYLHDAESALSHYNAYQELQQNDDKQVSKWIIDLQRRMKSARK